MSRGIRFSTVLQWFREGDADEVKAILPLVIEEVGKRRIVIMSKAAAGTAVDKPTGKDRSASARRAWKTRRANLANKPNGAMVASA